MKNKTEKKESESKKKEKSRENHKNDVDTDQKYAWKPTALTVVVLMFMSAAISFYGENEGQWFNSFLRNVGEHSYFQMSIMVSTSAIVGTFAFIYWGAVSDNLRSKKGR